MYILSAVCLHFAILILCEFRFSVIRQSLKLTSVSGIRKKLCILFYYRGDTMGQGSNVSANTGGSKM